MDETDDGPFAARVGEHWNWVIELEPEHHEGKGWEGRAVATREPTEHPGDDMGQFYVFHNLGMFATRAEAANHALEWVTHWIEINF